MFVKDKIDFPDNFSFNLFIATGQNYNTKVLHIHNCLEFNYVLEGNGINIIGDKDYTMQKEDIYVINNLEYHKAFSDGNLKLLIIVFDQFFLDYSEFDYLKAFYKKQMIFSNLITRNDTYHSSLKELFLQMKDEWKTKDDFYKLFIKAHLLKTLAILNRHYSQKNNDNAENTLKLITTPINKVIEYINFNFKEDITLTDLAAVANLNKTYLSTLFKKTINMSVFRYIQETRLWYAHYLILNTTLSITEISFNSGFKNLSHFTKCYREKYNITPTANRQESYKFNT